MTRLISRAAVGFAAVALLTMLASLSAPAQTTPTNEQLQMFQGLTPDQQQALLERVSGMQSRGSGESTQGAQESVTDNQRRAERRASSGDEQPEPLFPVLRPGDSVIVEMALPVEARTENEKQPAPQLAAPLQQNGQPVQPSPSATTPVATNPRESILRRNRAPLEVNSEERRKLEDLVRLVLDRNPYQLDRNGHLNLPGFAPIALTGLNEDQATQRLAVEPVLLRLDVRIVRLPLAKSGIAALKPFGYDIFDESPSTFAPVADTPVPADYIVGPGDRFNVQLFGSQNRNVSLVVNRDGTVSFPELGPIRVGGLSFTAAKTTVESRVARQLIGVRANVSMGGMRAIRVFVLGEVRQPGSYAVSGLATMTSALLASGGVKPIGSLRDVQLKRQGMVVRHFDLYDMLINGSTVDDAKLQPGDVIFVPPVGPTVSVDGEVRRPAIYELRGDTTAEAVLQMAGGMTPEADPIRSSVTRIDDQFRRVVFGVDFSAFDGRSRVLRNGDVMRIARLRPQLDSGVTLDGFVYRPGPAAWREGLRLTDVIGSVDELKPNADARYILIRRESSPDRRVSALSADLVAALANRGGAADVVLQPRDQITVFDLAPGRERIVKPLLDELRLQAGPTNPTQMVRVQGRVKAAGEYPLEPGMKVSDLLRAGGGLEVAAFGGQAELARYEVDASGTRQVGLVQVDLAALLRGDAGADLSLQPFDFLLIKETPDWTDQESVLLKGEVRFPGTYPIRRGETLFDVVQRAGGLTPRAFLAGSAFTRIELKEREQRQLDMLAERLQSDVAAMSLQSAAANQSGAGQALASGQSLLTQLRQAKAVGRLVIDLPGLMRDGRGSAKDVILRDGDQLIVPPQRQEVTVIGEVQSSTSHLYGKSLRRDDYIDLSGGFTRKADARRTYVVRANGSVLPQHAGLFRRDYDLAIQPGDTIVVPLDTERMPKLPFWQAVTQILYNVAVSVAAISNF